MKPRTCFVAVYVAFGLVAPAHAQIDCAAWNTKSFFLAAEVSDVTRCLQEGSDLEARGGDGLTPLHWAAGLGNAEAIEALAAAGAKLEARAESGFTPLHFAAGTGNAEAIEALAAAGAKLEARAESGSTPLHLAASIGNAETIAALTAAGAKLEARGGDGLTPLHTAASSREGRNHRSAVAASGGKPGSAS